MSIMPLERAAPMNTPIPAINSIVLKDAALAPTADCRKLTASLLTPTTRSKTARTNRKMTMHK